MPEKVTLSYLRGLICAVVLLLVSNNILIAQGTPQYGDAIPDLFAATNLKNVDVSQLTVEDIAKIKAEMQSNGSTIDQTEQIVLSKGLPRDQWAKLKDRLLRAPAVAPAPVTSTTRSTPAEGYKSYDTGTQSKVFGASFFNTASLSFEPNLRIATPTNYVVGPDDELLINVSGVQETSLAARVQPEGTIAIPQVGTINVNGLTIEQATARIRDRMASTAYPSIRANQSKLIVSLGNIRSIHITIVGAVKPGNYTISSLATVFNSIYLCGGPGDINTYRNIELIRGNKVVQIIDLYQFLTRGDQRGNVSLREGDVINFPVYKKQVVINGQVKRPGIFELKTNETLADLMFFAGGFTDRAYKASIKVKQITDTERQIKDIIRANFAAYQPNDGDVFQVDSVLDRYENGVAITGAVYRPGQFELTDGLTVALLIRKAGGLQENVFTDRAVLTRTNANGTKENITFNVNAILNNPAADIRLLKRDSVTIAAASEFQSRYKVRIDGEVRKPGEYRYRENFSLKDLIFLAGGTTDAASTYHIEVGRRIITDRADRNIDSIATVFNLNTNRGLEVETDRFILQPYDIVTIRRNPGYIEQQRVSIAGEVNFPGTYTIQSKKDHISDLLKKSGGLTPQAYDKGIFLIRNDVDSIQIHKQSVNVIQNSMRDTSAKVINDVGRTNVRIAVNLKKVLEEPGSIQDYVLQNGDAIVVLKQDPLVKVSGEVLSSTKTGYIEGKSLSYYLTQAGGTTDKARRAKIYVVYANGKVGRTHNGIFGLFRSYPSVETGAEVIVPRRPEHRGLTTGEAIGITSGIASLVSLIIVTISTLHN